MIAHSFSRSCGFLFQFRHCLRKEDSLIFRHFACRGSTPAGQEDYTQCWKCGSKLCKCCMICKSENCKAVQPVDGNECNYFSMFGIDEGFKVDEKKLELEFKNLQKQLHPDKFSIGSPEEKKVSLHTSSVVNQAYQILKSPVDRAAYLLSSKNINIMDEGKTYSDPKLMMEIFEMREEAEGLESNDDIDAMMKSLDSEVSDVSSRVQTHVETDNYNEAAKEAVRLKYLWKLLEDLRERRHDSA